MCIKIKDIKETEYSAVLYGPDNTKIGEIMSVVQLDDVRRQICNKRVSGYYIKWDDKIINIDRAGSLSEWPTGFFDYHEKCLLELCSAFYCIE